MADRAGCSCGRLKVGFTVTESRNWNPDCLDHGLGSSWYDSTAQVEQRAMAAERLRDLQCRAALRRKGLHDA